MIEKDLTPHKKLNVVLEFFALDIHKSKVNFEYLKGKIFEKSNNKIDEPDLVKILDKLQIDKCIELKGKLVTRTTGNYQETYLQEESKFYTITFDGMLFYENGGYISKFGKDENKRKKTELYDACAFEKLNYDLKISKFQSKVKWWPFIFSGIAIIISVATNWDKVKSLWLIMTK